MKGRAIKFLIWAVVLFTGAYHKDPLDDNGGLDGGNSENVSEINGTNILEGNNLVGLITDSSTGEGIPGIPVTDGYTFTVTDDNGVYQFVANKYCRNVYYSTPAGYKVALAQDSKLPLFYSTSTIDRNSVNRNDFILEPLSAPEDDLTLIIFSDPQVGNTSHVARFRDETKADIIDFVNSGLAEGTFKNPYAVDLGDIVSNVTSLFGTIKDALSHWEINDVSYGYLPTFSCIGNHDFDNSASSAYESVTPYVNYFGPTDYFFDRGKVHFVVMNNVVFTGNGSSAVEYDKGFTNLQMQWLEEYLALVENKEDKLIVFCTHIPLRDSNVANKEEVLTLLSQFREAHIMTGHTHYPQTYIHTSHTCAGGLPIYEHVHVAACGANWRGTLNTDGSPNGYAVYQIEGNTIVNWAAKSVNYPLSYQMRVYNGNYIPEGSTKYEWESKYKDCFIATVWNDDSENWTLEFISEDGTVTPMQRVTSGQRDWLAYAFMVNENGKSKNNTWYHRNLQHYWYVKSPVGDPSTATGWTVRATHTIPTSGKKNVYEENTLKTDFSGFAMYE